MASADRTAWQIASASEAGRVRPHNEDHCGTFANDAGALLLVVADGMGGHRGGATASHTAVEALARSFRATEAVSGVWLASAIRDANRAVHDRASGEPSLRGMGTTLVAVSVAAEGGAWVAHVGDSRAYRLREGTFELLTEDHSVVAELVRRGAITAEEAASHPRRNEILRSVGISQEVDVEWRELDLEPGDRVLLCSDGLCGVVPDSEIERLIADGAPAEGVARAVAAANDRGGPDNITAVLAEVPAPAEAAEPRGGAVALLALLALAGALLQFASQLTG